MHITYIQLFQTTKIQIFESNSQHNEILFYNRLKSPRYTRLQPLNIAVGEHV